MKRLSLLSLALTSTLLLPACRRELPDGLPQEYMDELIQIAENGAKHCARLLDDSNPDHCHGDLDDDDNEGPSSASILVPANPFRGSKAVIQLSVGCYYLEGPGRGYRFCDAPAYGSDPSGRIGTRKRCNKEFVPFRTWPTGAVGRRQSTELVSVTKNRQCPYLEISALVRRKGPNGSFIEAGVTFDQNILLTEKAARTGKR